MPKPAEERKSIPAEGEDLEALTQAIDKVTADKRAKELEIRSALADLDASLEKILLQSEFETAFEGIKDAEALAVEKQVDDIFKGLQSKEMPAAQAPESAKPKVEYDLMRLGDAKLRQGLLEMFQSRKIDVVLENYKHDFAQAELFDKPFNSVLEAAGVPEAGDAEKAAEALLLANNPAYAEMPPEKQAELRKSIKPMIEGAVDDLRRKWHEEVLAAASRKREMLEDNRQLLEEAAASLKGKALEEHRKSIEKNRQMIENANMLISGFSNPE